MPGKLYGIGVGPGDPELLTLKAKRLLEEADVIYVPRTSTDRSSTALSIIEKVLDTSSKKIVELVFPMSTESEILETSWINTSMEIRTLLEKNKNAALITLGDPTVYSTYMYIHKIIVSMGFEAEIVPGVTSFCASAARAGISIGENMESIAIIPSVYDLDRLDGAFDRFDNIVLMKVSGNLNEVLDRLKEKGLEGNAVVVSKCGFEDEKVYFGAQETGGEKLSYFTTMIIKKDRKES